jgi:hypothetical protein
MDEIEDKKKRKEKFSFLKAIGMTGTSKDSPSSMPIVAKTLSDRKKETASKVKEIFNE